MEIYNLKQLMKGGKMARKKIKATEWAMWFVGIVSTIAIGGLFLDGTTLINPLLKYLPEMIHTFVGWIVILGPITTIVWKFFN